MGLYRGGPDYPWWKYVNRPSPKFEEVAAIKERSQLASNVAFDIDARSVKLEYQNYALQGVFIYGVSMKKMIFSR